MPSLAVLKVLLREITSRERAPRIPEPCLVMDDPLNVEAYARAGTTDRVMAPVYLYNAAHACEVIHAGDTVIDLGCGPATQLLLVARLSSSARFIGLDLSEEMLASGRKLLDAEGISNVDLRVNDITNLSTFPDASVDAVISTLTLHHLPDLDSLRRTFREARRVLKPGGGVYINDFGRLKSVLSMRYFAQQYADRQSELFTLDYWNSLNAAFSFQDYRSAIVPLKGIARLYSTFMVPYMVAIKSAPRRDDVGVARGHFRDALSALPHHQQRDISDLATFFRLGGLSTQLL